MAISYCLLLVRVMCGGQACVLKQTEIPTGQVVKVTVSILFEAVCDVCMSGGLYVLMRSSNNWTDWSSR
jgi:hypothetical protein